MRPALLSALLAIVCFGALASPSRVALRSPAFIGSLSAPPVVMITSPTSAATYEASGATATVDGTATNAPSSVTWTAGGGSPNACTGTTSFSCSVTGLTAWLDETITITATNAAGSATDTLSLKGPCGSTAPVALYRPASQGLADGAAIGTLTSYGSASSADATQGTAAAKPTYQAACINGEGCATFDGGDRIITAEFTSTAQPFTVCHIAGSSVAGTTQSVFDRKGTPAPITNMMRSNLNAWTGNAGVLLTGAAATLSNFDVVCFYANGASSAVVVSGSSTSGNAGTNAIDSFNFGSSSAGTQFLTGKIAAAWICDGDKRTAGKTYADADFGSTWPKAF